MDLNKILSDHFCNYYNIKNSLYTIEKIDAKELIVPERIDLIAKYKYIEHRENKYVLSYVNDLYAAHIDAFSTGKFIEPGQEETKNSISAYLGVFDDLINNIKTIGFDSSTSVVPVGNDNILLDGSHRTAIAAFYDIPLPIIRFDIESTIYGTEFFTEQLMHQDYIDYMVTEYCKLNCNVYMAILWPKAFSRIKAIDVDNIIRGSCKTVYKKKIRINFNGLKNLMTQVYQQEDWLGSAANGFIGAKSKALECYDKCEKLIVYILESKDASDVAQIKQRVRDISRLDNSAIHTTDSASETVSLCKTLLNKNSLNLLFYGNSCCYTKAHEKIDLFKRRLLEHNLNSEEFIIDSSGILALYGLRDIDDLDFLSLSEEYNLIEDSDTIRNHHDYTCFFDRSLYELIYDPNNHLIYNGIKFVTLEVLRTMKRNRDEPKDRIDVTLINSFLHKSKSRKNAFTHFIQKKKPSVIRICRCFRNDLIAAAIKLLKMTGTYPIVKFLYRSLILREQDIV